MGAQQHNENASTWARVDFFFFWPRIFVVQNKNTTRTRSYHYDVTYHKEIKLSGHGTVIEEKTVKLKNVTSWAHEDCNSTDIVVRKFLFFLRNN